MSVLIIVLKLGAFKLRNLLLSNMKLYNITFNGWGNNEVLAMLF